MTFSHPAAPDGPPLDMQLEALTSHSIKVSWKVKSQFSQISQRQTQVLFLDSL